MSATNHTTNYNLPQFVGSDKPAWLGDINPALNTIDGQMKTNADDISGLNTNLGLTDTKATTALNKATGLESKFTLDNYSRKQASELVSITGINTDGTFYVAEDDSGSVFKFYNYIAFTNSTQSAIPITLTAIPGLSGVYGLKILTLRQAPAEAYTVLGAGLYIFKNSGNLQNVNIANFTVGTDGGIYVMGSTISTWNINAGQTMQIVMHPSIYFNVSFGDE